MDLLLVNTPIHDYGVYPRAGTSYSTPLGLLYLHAFVTCKGFSCEILDAEAGQLSIDAISTVVLERRPRFLGLNAFSVNFGFLRLIAQSVESMTQVIVGGPHASLCSIAHLSSALSFAHFVVRGGGEAPLVAILEGRRGSALPSSVYSRRSDHSFQQGMMSVAPYADFASLPLPTRGATRFEPYVRDGLLWSDIAVSRGCKYKCAFCSGSSHSSGLAYTQRSVDHSLAELKLLRDQFGVQGIEIVDDLPFRNKAELTEFLSAASRADFHFQWELNLPISVIKTIPEDDWVSLRRLGLSRIAFGVESGDEVIRRRMGKKASDREVLEICANLRTAGIRHKIYLILGFPGETRVETAATIALANRIVDCSAGSAFSSPRLFIYKPFPGSFLWNELVTKYSEEELLRFTDFSLERSYFNKHAWMPAIQLCESSALELVEQIDEFYCGRYAVPLSQ